MDSTNLTHAIILVAVIGGWVAYWVAALASIFRRPDLSSFERGVWTVVVIVLPFLGPLNWFVWGRTRTRDPAPQI